MKIRLNKETPIYIAFFCITLGWSKFFANIGLSTLLEYAGIVIILYGIYWRKYDKSTLKKLRYLFIVLFFFWIGIIVQDLDLSRKLTAIVSMLVLASIAVMPCKYICSFNHLACIEKAIVLGLIVSTVTAIASGAGVLTLATEGVIVKFGFNAGIEHRNYFAYILLCLFFIEYIRFEVGIQKNKKKLLILFVFIFLTNSKSSWILLFLFLAITNINRFKMPKHKKSIAFALFCIFLVLVSYPIFQFLSSNSETFFFRVNGLYNYISKMSGDTFHIVFGNLKIAYGKSYMTYDENIRSVIGWDGSTELVILNVMLKNGLMGFVGYLLIFKKYFGINKMFGNIKFKMIVNAVLICFIVSAFVESYVANINHLFTIFTYLLLCNAFKIEYELSNN